MQGVERSAEADMWGWAAWAVIGAVVTALIVTKLYYPEL